MAAEGARRSLRRERLAAGLAIVVTAAVVAGASPWLGSRSGSIALVPPEDPRVVLDREVSAEFGMESPVVWVIEARSGSIWTRPVLTGLVELTRGALRIPGVRAADVMSLASPNVRQVRQSATGISPEYVMASVPATDAGIEDLRRRVEADENLAGTLVARDGRAAMVVANFAPDADGPTVAEAALGLADRVAGDEALVHVVGAPVMAEGALRFARGAWLPFAVALFAVGVAAALILGGSRLLAVVASAALAVAWTGLALALGGVLVWPWSGLALPPVVLLAVTAAVACEPGATGRPTWSRVLTAGAVLVTGFAFLAVVTPAPARAFGVAGATGSLAAVVAGRIAAAITDTRARDAGRWKGGGWLSGFAVAAVVVALLGLPLLTASFGLAGYGERYLAGPAGESLRSVRRAMPPPTQLALRVRGEPGFVASPAVLEAMDELAGAARRDGRVERAQSLADIVKLVHRTFNDGDPEYATLPEDRGLISRYLALAYSPVFRRFVDRGLGRSAVWVHLSTDDAGEVAEVIGLLDAQLQRSPIPGAQVDVWAGDGAVLVVMARLAHALIGGAAALIVGAVAAAAFLLGWRAAWHVVAGAVSGAVVAAGGLGWLGLPLDLVSLTCAAGAIAAGAGAGVWRSAGTSGALPRLAAAAAVAGVLAVAAPIAATRVLGLQVLGHAVALLVVARSEHAESNF